MPVLAWVFVFSLLVLGANETLDFFETRPQVIAFFDLEAEEFDCDAVRQQGIRSYRKRWFPGGERLIWGRTDIMKKFLSVYKDLDNIWSDKPWKEYGITEDYHREACSEHLMWHFANKHNIKYFATSLSPVNVKLLRHDGRYIV